ncbi:MAG: ATP-binding protein [Candidatus Omnitrophota bacterium]|nr:HAMP domain-containing protein [Candidatus Omnitrophota bacterium]
MAKIKRQSIRAKIRMLGAFFLLEICVLTVLLFGAINRYQEGVTTFSRIGAKLELVRNLEVSLLEVVAPAHDFLIQGSEANESLNFKDAVVRVESSIIALRKTVTSSEAKILADIEKQYLQSKKIALRIFNLPDVIREREGGALMEKMDALIAVDALGSSRQLYSYISSEFERARSFSRTFGMTVVSFIITVIFVNAIFVILIIVVFDRRIVLPIMQLQSAALEFSAGNLSRRVALDVDNEVGDLAVIFNEMAVKRQLAEEETRQNYHVQSVLNDILKISLEDISLDELLKKVLARLFSIVWFALEKRGGIFLADEAGQMLLLRAQEGSSERLLSMCACVPFGKCLCGRAAVSGVIEFAHCIDSRHEVSYTGISPHGHYCVPIIARDKKNLGVMNLYLKENHQDSVAEREFLVAVANVLAGIIERRLTDERLRQAYEELVKTQEELIQAEKSKAIGQLAAGIAHEVRNPLAIIMQSADYLEIKLSNDKEISEVARLIKDNIKRADNIICALVDFSKVTQLGLEALNINSVIENSLLLIPRGSTFENVQVVKTLGEPLPKVLADTKKMTQVFINIFLNAIQAMPEGGKLFVRTYTAQFSKPLHDLEELNLIKTGETIVRIEIEDTGEGISPEHLKMIFDPFFTTRGPQKGTGLGLTVTRNIIQMHKGFIDVESQVQKGTKFIITLKGVGE